ncbi:MAG: hypothetical protein H6595_13760 [Flavobacteriales bacterium]|nr:hypothetical protein [Flavobacteriales bacterium]MCB9168532.1 hypothetical protein [Flavobacteriales bacterium]
MSRTVRLIRWRPRVFALSVAGFLALFALDAFEGDATAGEKLFAFFLHLAPTWILLLVAALAWRRERLGAVAFALLTLVYAVWAWPRMDWIAVIGGLLACGAVLYAVAWRMRRKA